MLVGPLVLLIYEPLIGGARWRDCGGFLVRIGIVGVLASLWWIMPLLVHVRYGIDFLQFTEQPASIWGTNSVTESLRLMGYWTSYIGVGFDSGRPFFPTAARCCSTPSLSVPGFCCRPWRSPGSCPLADIAMRRCCWLWWSSES